MSMEYGYRPDFRSEVEPEVDHSPEPNKTEHPEDIKTPELAETKQFGWNDLIVPEEDSKAAQDILREFGYEAKSMVLSKTKYFNEEKTAGRSGEILLSVVHAESKEPVTRDVIVQMMAAIRKHNDEERGKHIVVRVARLAEGEHFG